MGSALPAERFDLRRLGGVVKVARIFGQSLRPDYSLVADFLAQNHATGKLTFGLSVVGAPPAENRSWLVGVKKALQARDIAARFVNKNFAPLSSAQTAKELLKYGDHEIVVVARPGGGYVLAATSAVQPFDEYRARDYEKAVRSAAVGMLPPKLAQILVNLAGVPAPSRETREAIIYDPFCGTGTVLLEAGLLGYGVAGSDLNPAMVAAATQNLAQLKLTGPVCVHDAAQKMALPFVPAAAISEGYLGPAFVQLPDLLRREKIAAELAALYSRFFGWITAPVVVLTLPVYCRAGVPQFFSSSVIRPAIEKLGWQLAVPKALANPRARVYVRPDQTVGREVTVWKRKN